MGSSVSSILTAPQRHWMKVVASMVPHYLPADLPANKALVLRAYGPVRAHASRATGQRR
jgi:hypothetical protein